MNQVQIQNKITLMPGSYVEPGVEIEENVYIGHNAVILSHNKEDDKKTIIRAGAHIGANATVLQELLLA